MAVERGRTVWRTGSFLRLVVLVIAIADGGFAAYVFWTLFIDDTTAWIVTVVPDLEAVWRQMVIPPAVAGVLASVLAIRDRGVWLALAIALAGPLVSLWLLA